jgi:glucan phosphoethanolaminetransferase (alkaline phosphatase superfamily)
MVDFSPAFSASNCSNATNGVLRLGADPRRLGHEEVDILNNPSVWKYASAAGFETSFIEVQSEESGITAYYMNGEEVALVDDYLSIPLATPDYMWDQKVAREIADRLARPGPQFVYVNKFGVHFPYGNRYPPELASSAMRVTASFADDPKARLEWEYSLAIRWAVDAFFETLLDLIDLDETVLIYTSDHGQNLLDDGRLITHCRHPDPIVEEALVPLFVLTNKPDLRRSLRQAAANGQAPASHFQVFPTVLELFGYPREPIRQRYYQSLFEPTTESLGFLSGSIRPRFGRLPSWNAVGASLHEVRGE